MEKSSEHPDIVHITRSFSAFDTVICLDLWGAVSACEEAARITESECSRYDQLLSIAIPTSDIGRMNAAHGEWVSIDVETAELLEAALEYCDKSFGAFDITVGAASRAWDFKNGGIPDPEVLAKAMSHVDWRKVRVDIDNGRARIDDPYAMVDLGGIAKGWIADKLRERLMSEGLGLCGTIINLGGNIIVGGSKPDGESWKIGVKDPFEPSRDIAVLPIRMGSLVTSGTYERSFMKDGRLYHHILDPKTGLPVKSDLMSATLVCERSLDAEGYSTSVLALGAKRGAGLIREHPEIMHACLVTLDRDVILL